jgi:hypothetical protein
MSRLVVGAVALLLALAGCGGDPKPDPSPSASTPVTSPASTTPAPPVMPEEAKADTKAGAIAFVRYYISVFNHAQSTGATSELAALSSSDCADCQVAIDGLRGIYSAGGSLVGGDLVPGPATARENSIEQVWLVLVRVDSGPQSVTTATNAESTQMPGGSRSMQFRLSRSSGDWEVVSWSRA